MAKRIIKIILILLAIFFLLLIGMWLIGRHQAQKAGKHTLSFKQFLGLSTLAPTNANNTQGTLSSVFTSGSQSGSGLSNTPGATGNNNTGGPGNIGGPTNNSSAVDNSVQTSQFTSDTFAPDTTVFNGSNNVGTGNLAGAGSGLGSGNLINSGSGGIGEGQTGGTSSGGISTTGSGLGGDSSGTPGCSTADTTITFTPEEIGRLNALQTQYNQISADLASNDDVSTELSNYTTYKLQEVKIAELQNFCQTNTPLLSDPAYQRHVPTPFWHDLTQDSETFTAGTVSAAAIGSNPQTGESFLERILRINLW
ncbi:MAG TPA: hypothetical protein VL576_03790 [Candidatus Paceibacterota bacterium]|jgi:hypothetical protein|nr:hypothetical protein [Candidatus Paceibacterota bacterium]